MTMKDLYFIDGYNIIFAWDELKQLARESLEHSRERLQSLLASYGKAKGIEIVVVFDAMHTDDDGKIQHIGADCTVLFTDKDETADSRIEKLVYTCRNRQRTIYVATSDGPEQFQVLGSGACRLSARELADDVRRVREEAKRYHVGNGGVADGSNRNEVVYRVRDRDVLKKLEELRRSK
ncbi:NYN domain-containing protein [Megasphaera vaginalis (ex Srinivasan et al. 2021)]|nr:NYN domain-containing protein [Megasphaera vaginalis (ex Srinivasan et al. 2021)]